MRYVAACARVALLCVGIVLLSVPLAPLTPSRAAASPVLAPGSGGHGAGGATKDLRRATAA